MSCEAFEVDALPPPTLRQLIRDGFERHLDLDLMGAIKDREQAEREVVQSAIAEIEA